MSIEINPIVFFIAAPLALIGFILVWWQVSFWAAVGVTLLCVASGIRQSN